MQAIRVSKFILPSVKQSLKLKTFQHKKISLLFIRAENWGCLQNLCTDSDALWAVWTVSAGSRCCAAAGCYHIHWPTAVPCQQIVPSLFACVLYTPQMTACSDPVGVYVHAWRSALRVCTSTGVPVCNYKSVCTCFIIWVDQCRLKPRSTPHHTGYLAASSSFCLLTCHLSFERNCYWNFIRSVTSGGEKSCASSTTFSGRSAHFDW